MMAPIYLRVSDNLKRAIERKALEEGVSVNEFATHALAEAVGEDGVPAEGEAELDLEKTLELLIGAAVAHRTVTYLEVARASGVEWNKARRPIVGHLERVWDECVARGLPCLDALVVRQADGSPGDGLVKLAIKKGRQVSDPASFAKMLREECFRWGDGVKRSGRSATEDSWAHLRGTWKGPDVDDIQTYMRGPPDETATEE